MTQSAMPPAPHPDVIAIRRYLTFAAHHRQLVTPAQVVAGSGVVKTRLVQRIDELNRREHADGNPLLGAIVTQGESGRPSPGCLRLLKELFGTTADEQELWRAERDRVWAFEWGD